jgi:hypothetical protein
MEFELSFLLSELGARMYATIKYVRS